MVPLHWRTDWSGMKWWIPGQYLSVLGQWSNRFLSVNNSQMVWRWVNGRWLFILSSMCAVREQFLNNTHTLSSYKWSIRHAAIANWLLTGIWTIYEQSKTVLSVFACPWTVHGLSSNYSQTDRISGGVLKDYDDITHIIAWGFDDLSITSPNYNHIVIDRNKLCLCQNICHVTLELYLVNHHRQLLIAQLANLCEQARQGARRPRQWWVNPINCFHYLETRLISRLQKRGMNWRKALQPGLK